jgi:hypothetical protein
LWKASMRIPLWTLFVVDSADSTAGAHVQNYKENRYFKEN